MYDLDQGSINWNLEAHICEIQEEEITELLLVMQQVLSWVAQSTQLA
jgi:hypothetical protein